jgi:glycosyltransferase involved in cell wall biosynthesis
LNGFSEAQPPPPGRVADVALVSESRDRDGHQQHFRLYLRALEAVGLPYSVYQCVDPSSASEYSAEGTRVYGRRVPGSAQLEMGLNRLFRVYPRRLRALPERVVHVNDAFLAPLTQYRGHVVVTLADLSKMTTHYFPRVSVWLHNRSLRQIRDAQAVVCSSEYVRQEILSLLPVAESQVHVVPLRSLLPLAAEPRRPPPPPTARAPWTLLYVAGDRPRKNLPLFFEILRRLDDRYRGLLVSRLRPSTQDTVSRMGLGPRLEIRSWVEDLTATYRSAQLLVHTAPYEGFGIPLAEALSQGLPVVAANRTSIPEVVGPGGLLVDEDSPEAWCRAVERLSDPELYSRLSSAALAQSDRFPLPAIGARLREAYGLGKGPG